MAAQRAPKKLEVGRITQLNGVTGSPHSVDSEPPHGHTTKVRPLPTTIDELVRNLVQTERDAALAAIIERVEALEAGTPRWPRMMTADTAAAYLDVSVRTINRLVAEGHLTAVIPYGMTQRFYNVEELDRWRKSRAA